MPRAGVSARPASRNATAWWEDLDREAFRFPAAREVRAREVRPTEVRARERPRRPAPTHEAQAPVTPLPAPASVSHAGGGRGTVAKPKLRRYERPGFQPDRVALWAVLLGLCLILVAAASAVLH